MKIGLFTDSHYSSQEVTCGCRYNNQSLRKIREAYTAFEAADCDLVICLGDLTDKEDTHQKEAENLREIAELIAASPIPTVCVMGNHDAFTMSAEEFYGILGGCVPENRELDGKPAITKAASITPRVMTLEDGPTPAILSSMSWNRFFLPLRRRRTFSFIRALTPPSGRITACTTQTCLRNCLPAVAR